jgi:hypothetical protein
LTSLSSAKRCSHDVEGEIAPTGYCNRTNPATRSRPTTWSVVVYADSPKDAGESAT